MFINNILQIYFVNEIVSIDSFGINLQILIIYIPEYINKYKTIH